MRKLALHWQILIAIVLAFIAGLWMFSIKEATGNQPAIFGVEFLAMFNFVGEIFLQGAEYHLGALGAFRAQQGLHGLEPFLQLDVPRCDIGAP